jgi:hypothetical protein
LNPPIVAPSPRPSASPASLLPQGETGRPNPYKKVRVGDRVGNGPRFLGRHTQMPRRGDQDLTDRKIRSEVWGDGLAVAGIPPTVRASAERRATPWSTVPKSRRAGRSEDKGNCEAVRRRAKVRVISNRYRKPNAGEPANVCPLDNPWACPHASRPSNNGRFGSSRPMSSTISCHLAPQDCQGGGGGQGRTQGSMSTHRVVAPRLILTRNHSCRAVRAGLPARQGASMLKR